MYIFVVKIMLVWLGEETRECISTVYCLHLMGPSNLSFFFLTLRLANLHKINFHGSGITADVP